MEVRKILNHLRAGQSNRRIAQDVGLDRRTVGRIRVWAQQEGLLTGELPAMAELQSRMASLYVDSDAPQVRSSVAPYAQQVQRLHREGVENAAIWERLKERGFTGGYSAVWRYIQKLSPSGSTVTVRVETEPGVEAQVDFGYAGKMIDPESGELRKSWAFVMLLSWSRHQYGPCLTNVRYHAT